MPTHPHNDDKRLLELLERWQSGDFTRANEQELQALANSDEFRRDVVEGFWSMPETDHAMRLVSLRELFHQRSGRARRVAFPTIMAAAAAIGVLILATIWLLPSEQKIAPLTQQEAPIPIENQPIASNFPEEKSTGPEMRNAVPPTAGPGKLDHNKSSSRVLDAAPEASGGAAEIESAPASSVVIEKEELADRIITAKPTEGEAAYKKVLDEMDEADQAAGNSFPRSEAAKEAPAKANDALKKQAPAKSKASQPADGWAKFQDYLRRNARLTEAARQNNVSGLVRLKFRLDTNNQPVDFQTLRSLGYGCDEEAIRLVKAYQWQRGSDPEVTLDVSFVR